MSAQSFVDETARKNHEQSLVEMMRKIKEKQERTQRAAEVKQIEEMAFGDQVWHFMDGFAYSVRDSYTYGYYSANNPPTDNNSFRNGLMWGESAVNTLSVAEMYLGGFISSVGSGGTTFGLATCPVSGGLGCLEAAGAAAVTAGGVAIAGHGGSVLLYNESKDGGGDGNGGDRISNPTKAESPIWQNTKPYKGKIRTNGETGKNSEYYEWDYTHNDIEVYDWKGNHLGSVDPITGIKYKDAVLGRTIKSKL